MKSYKLRHAGKETIVCFWCCFLGFLFLFRCAYLCVVMLLLAVVAEMDETVVELGCVVAAFFALIVDVYNCGPCLLLFINFNLLPWLLVLLVLLMFSLFFVLVDAVAT